MTSLVSFNHSTIIRFLFFVVRKTSYFLPSRLSSSFIAISKAEKIDNLLDIRILATTKINSATIVFII